jgi:hypothetical protein
VSYHVLLNDPRFSGICKDQASKLEVLLATLEDAWFLGIDRAVKASPTASRVAQKAKRKQRLLVVFVIFSELYSSVESIECSLLAFTICENNRRCECGCNTSREAL